jgi:hypothetical protein
MTRTKNTERGFPGGCPLPDSLAQDVLSRTSNKHRACYVCKNMADRTGFFREKCNHWQGLQNAY